MPEATHIQIGVAMTCHNRRAKTLHCLEQLYAQVGLNEQFEITTFLVDDGSSDGTGEAVKSQFSEVNVLEGDGNLYWNGGMHKAYGEALKGDFDYFLWLNDDVSLHKNAIIHLLNTYQELLDSKQGENIILGGMADPETGKCSYGGFLRQSKWSLRMTEVEPGDEPKQCSANTGNCVLIPRVIARWIGNIEPFYKHRWGDPDYGLRAGKMGFGVWLASGFVGTCEGNPTAERWTDSSLSFSEKLKDFHSVKGYGKKDWKFYVKRHGGPLWFLLWLKPYFDMVIGGKKKKLRMTQVSTDGVLR